MGYRKTNNLYKDQRILMFKECYALEKIHGTSAHIKFHTDDKENTHVTFFSGREKYENFIKLFNSLELLEIYNNIFKGSEVTIYGEAYGGKCQGMSKTYGTELKFVAFEVKINDTWLSVSNAHDITSKFELEFVDYVRISADMESIDAQRDRDSVQAIRNGMGEGHMREGVVLRPLIEFSQNDDRIICKHKRAEFSETKTPREVSPDTLTKMIDADKIVDEWVTEMRLDHVLDHLIATECIPDSYNIEHVKYVIMEMQNDIQVEAEGEIELTKLVLDRIAKRTVAMYQKRLASKID